MVGLARPDDPALHPRLIVAECLRFHTALYATRTDETQIRNALAHVKAETLFDRRVRTLSSGERAKVSLAKALLHAPRLLILDELSRVLDPGAAQQVRRRLAEVVADGTAVLLVTHDLNEAALADRVVVLEEGRAIASGTWNEVKQITHKVFGL
jgi:ABC-type multidrug transport system ATPase subunit